MTTKATPRLNIQGFLDNTGGNVSVQPEQIPQHLPISYILTERGDGFPHMVIGDTFNRQYGAVSLEPTSPFATHQSLLLKTMMAEGNIAYVQRIIPPNAKKARLRLSVEVIPTTLPVYERGPDGSISYRNDGNGGSVAVTNGTSIGHRLVWHSKLDMYAEEYRGLGQGNIITDYRNGSILANGQKLGEIEGASTFSTLYPIIDLEVSSEGAFGNNVGIRFNAPTVDSAESADVSLIESVKAFVYRLVCVERKNAATNPTIQRTKNSDLSVNLVLKENVQNTRTNLPLSFNDTFVQSYQELDNPGQPPQLGPFGNSHLYSDNLNTVIDLLVEGDAEAVNPILGEKEYDLDAAEFGRSLKFADQKNRHLLNIFTGVDYNNVPYFSFEVANSVLFGGITFNNEAVNYAAGGDDGLVYDVNGRPDRLAIGELYDNLVQAELLNFGDGIAPMLDMARFPISAIWDSGYSLETKKAMLTLMSRRKDVTVFLSTHSVGDYIGSGDGRKWTALAANDEATEIAIATTLSNAALLTPESIIFATPACRCAIVGHSGELTDVTWRGRFPLTIDVAQKVARYMGAGDGKYVRDAQFDEESGNRVSLFKVSSVNLTYKTDNNYDRSWDAGIVWVQYADTRTLFYPAFQTVYPDSSSIFNSLIVVMAASELTKVAHRVWTRLVGNTRLKPQAFLEKSDELITQYTTGRFDDRFTITPRTSFTKADEERAYSWSTEIIISSNTMKLVNSLTISGSLEDYQSA